MARLGKILNRQPPSPRAPTPRETRSFPNPPAKPLPCRKQKISLHAHLLKIQKHPTSNIQINEQPTDSNLEIHSMLDVECSMLDVSKVNLRHPPPAKSAHRIRPAEPERIRQRAYSTRASVGCSAPAETRTPAPGATATSSSAAATARAAPSGKVTASTRLPAPPSKCPMLAFVELTGIFFAPSLRPTIDRRRLRAVVQRRPRPVRIDIIDLVRRQPGRRARRVHRRQRRIAIRMAASNDAHPSL